jgi:hypothetical protein
MLRRWNIVGGIVGDRYRSCDRFAHRVPERAIRSGVVATFVIFGLVLVVEGLH